MTKKTTVFHPAKNLAMKRLEKGTRRRKLA